MKKKSTKLQLSRETLRSLDESPLLGEVVGATAYPSCGCTNNCDSGRFCTRTQHEN